MYSYVSGQYTSTPYNFLEQMSQLQEEVQPLLDKGAVVPVPLADNREFYSSLFLLLKKNGGKKPVINLKTACRSACQGRRSNTIFPAPLYLQRDLHRALIRSVQHYNATMTISHPAKEELAWWQAHLTSWNGQKLLQYTKQITIQSNAAQSGLPWHKEWGSVVLAREMHINLFWERLTA